jgi:hypothetical protein
MAKYFDRAVVSYKNAQGSWSIKKFETKKELFEFLSYILDRTGYFEVKTESDWDDKI